MKMISKLVLVIRQSIELRESSMITRSSDTVTLQRLAGSRRTLPEESG